LDGDSGEKRGRSPCGQQACRIKNNVDTFQEKSPFQEEPASARGIRASMSLKTTTGSLLSKSKIGNVKSCRTGTDCRVQIDARPLASG
jgi:hypothetical protein